MSSNLGWVGAFQGHVHLYLKEIGQGIQHIASRVEDLPTLVPWPIIELPSWFMIQKDTTQT